MCIRSLFVLMCQCFDPFLITILSLLFLAPCSHPRSFLSLSLSSRILFGTREKEPTSICAFLHMQCCELPTLFLLRPKYRFPCVIFVGRTVYCCVVISRSLSSTRHLKLVSPNQQPMKLTHRVSVQRLYSVQPKIKSPSCMYASTYIHVCVDIGGWCGSDGFFSLSEPQFSPSNFPRLNFIDNEQQVAVLGWPTCAPLLLPY